MGNTVFNPWAPAGAMDALGSVTVPSGGLSSITFSAIPQTYTHLQIRFISRDSRSVSGVNSPMEMQFNGDTGNNYARHDIYGDGSSAGAEAAASTNAIWMNSSGNANASNMFGGGVIDILDYTNANKNKTSRALSGGDYNGAGFLMLSSGVWMNTSPITSITFFGYTAPFLQYSNFSLYGIR
jgi:hypothetical protein